MSFYLVEMMRGDRSEELDVVKEKHENIILITRDIKNPRVKPLPKQQRKESKNIITKISLEIRLRTFTAIASTSLPPSPTLGKEKTHKTRTSPRQITSRVIYIRQCGAN